MSPASPEAFSVEKGVAIAAVRRACLATCTVFNQLVRDRTDTLSKEDESPVTGINFRLSGLRVDADQFGKVGDYTAQAVINTVLKNAFPKDPIVGEEGAAALRYESNARLRERVVSLATNALQEDLIDGEKSQWGLGSQHKHSSEVLLAAIDEGNDAGGPNKRMWTVDPIDGTKGFLRGGQYAVCLSLIVNSQVVLGVIGCPNLLTNPANPEGEKGCIFVAVRGQGAFQIALSGDSVVKLPYFRPEKSYVLQSEEPKHTNLPLIRQVSDELHLTEWAMDSQAKYCCVARGEGAVYLRMPAPTTGGKQPYEEKIWDHAPGSVLVEESGGKITDSEGASLQFGLGRGMGENRGFIATVDEELHGRVVSALERAQFTKDANKTMATP
ncbi:3',5'-bisphosphate nucleotidase [Suillus clintonianus]|uniref:3',5'-bisphosphate nucleotidase n=1 Tax=Suillus clintonianus TaxID=1904413 RepID=UPI001B865986|nr:3',5'-bisphosphate nucleotidase [Suillus clintonianus]KAG2148922.1 3',5'-bisphosphate nucleotidase [Suillus clintonianus]